MSVWAYTFYEIVMVHATCCWYAGIVSVLQLRWKRHHNIRFIIQCLTMSRLSYLWCLMDIGYFYDYCFTTRISTDCVLSIVLCVDESFSHHPLYTETCSNHSLKCASFFGQTRQDMAMMQPGLNDKTWMMIIKVYQVNVSLPLASKTHPFVENPHTLEQIFRFCLLFDVVLTFWWFDKYFCLQCWQINRRLSCEMPFTIATHR